MPERFPAPPERPEPEQYEFFEEDELVDPDKDTKKLLEFIKEADTKAEKEAKEGKKERKKKKKPTVH